MGNKGLFAQGPCSRSPDALGAQGFPECPLAGPTPVGGHTGRGFWLLLHLGFLCCFSPASGQQGWDKDIPFFLLPIPQQTYHKARALYHQL